MMSEANTSERFGEGKAFKRNDIRLRRPARQIIRAPWGARVTSAISSQSEELAAMLKHHGLSCTSLTWSASASKSTLSLL
jgi:hypothetical protein